MQTLAHEDAQSPRVREQNVDSSTIFLGAEGEGESTAVMGSTIRAEGEGESTAVMGSTIGAEGEGESTAVMGSTRR